MTVAETRSPWGNGQWTPGGQQDYGPLGVRAARRPARAGDTLGSASTHFLFANVTSLAGQSRINAEYLLGGRRWFCAGIAETHLSGEGQLSVRKFAATRGFKAHFGKVELSDKQNPLGGLAMFVNSAAHTEPMQIFTEDWDDYLGSRILPRLVRISPACTVLS